MIVECPDCGKRYRLDDRYRDRERVTVKCRECGRRFVVGSSGEGEGDERPASSPGPGGGAKILLADDSVYFRTMVGDILHHEGYEVIFGGDGEEALNLMRSERPDLLILDLHLPKMSGFDVIKEVKKEADIAAIPILVMSSVFTETSHVMALNALGVNEFIDKQFRPAYLIGRVKQLIGG